MTPANAITFMDGVAASAGLPTYSELIAALDQANELLWHVQISRYVQNEQRHHLRELAAGIKRVRAA